MTAMERYPYPAFRILQENKEAVRCLLEAGVRPERNVPEEKGCPGCSLPEASCGASLLLSKTPDKKKGYPLAVKAWVFGEHNATSISTHIRAENEKEALEKAKEYAARRLYVQLCTEGSRLLRCREALARYAPVAAKTSPGKAGQDTRRGKPGRRRKNNGR